MFGEGKTPGAPEATSPFEVFYWGSVSRRLEESGIESTTLDPDEDVWASVEV